MAAHKRTNTKTPTNPQPSQETLPISPSRVLLEPREEGAVRPVSPVLGPAVRHLVVGLQSGGREGRL